MSWNPWWSRDWRSIPEHLRTTYIQCLEYVESKFSILLRLSKKKSIIVYLAPKLLTFQTPPMHPVRCIPCVHSNITPLLMHYAPSPGFLALQLTILTLSAWTDWLPLSILKVTFLIKKVHTSSQNRYVSRLPCAVVSIPFYFTQKPLCQTNLELQPTLDILLQCLGNGLVKIAENLHSKLRVDALLADQVVERVRQSEPDAAAC